MNLQATIALPSVLICVALVVGGCAIVPKEQYDKAIADLEQSRQEAKQYKLELAALRGDAPADTALASGRPDVGPTAKKPSTLPADSADMSATNPLATTSPAVSPELAARMKALLDELNSGATSRPAPVVAKFTGKITAVKDDLAGIDVGEGKGVKAGQRLYIYREGKFVGFLLVEHVEADSAAGVISEQQIAPAVGDKVTSVLE